MDEQPTAVEVQMHWPENRLPVTVLLDDPTPCRNPAWYEFPDAGHVAVVPNRFTEHFAEVGERTGAAGKFSIIPCPGAQGRIDEGMPGVPEAEMDEFLRLARERIAPRWDICPELLTHNKALDLATMRPLPLREDAWVAQQDEETLVAYIGRALQILRNAGLAPNGVTSPWSTGRAVEGRYAAAIATALRAVSGVRLGWYFLHVDQHSPRVEPRLMEIDPGAGTALVSIVSGSMDEPNAYDFAWRTQLGEPATLDKVLSADGTAGRLAALFLHGSPLTFHTHWQSLFSNGTGAGLAAFEELCGRINRAWGEQVRWTTARELAVAAAARAATRVVAGEGGRLTLRAPFACAAFTFSLPLPAGVTTLLGDGRPLEYVAAAEGPMREGTWRREGSTARVCVDLRDGLVLTWKGEASSGA
jgi:hypothetical protein